MKGRVFQQCVCGLQSTEFVQRVTRPAPTCCPCTNLLLNAGFDQGTNGVTPPFWFGTGVRSSGGTTVHSGSFVNGVATFGVALLTNGQFLCQSVPVIPGCCYRLSFEVRLNGTSPAAGFGEASVQFNTSVPNTGTCMPPGLITPPQGDAILIADTDAGNAYLTYTMVVCTPRNAQSACICFQNALGGNFEMRLDNVVFSTAGGPCGGCGVLPFLPLVNG
jgi:hypothetical protein